MHTQPLTGTTLLLHTTPGSHVETHETEESSQPLINLELGVAGSCDLGQKKPKQERAESLFTAERLHELWYQTFLFHLFRSGLAVPFHILYPVWKSVFRTYGPAIYKKFPSFAGSSSSNSNHGSMMDPEPGRCRRTDGRKWRCSKNAVPREKYCERHMHRGRKCSRKHVEHSKTVLELNDGILKYNNRPVPISSFPCDLGITALSSDPSTGVPTIKLGGEENQNFFSCIQPTISASSHDVDLKNNVNAGASNAATRIVTSVFGKEAVENRGTTNKSNHTEGKDVGGSNNVKAWKVNIRFRNNDVQKNNPACPTAPGFESGSECVTMGVLKRASRTETEPNRCKRTDGRKWQCKKDVVSGENYCKVHLHRGAKRINLESETVPSALASTPSQGGCTSSSLTKDADNNINLNIKPPSPEENSGSKSTSTSDATTITDENSRVISP